MTSTSGLRHPISFGEGCFQFFTKNRPKKQQKRAILHTSQANGGGSSPPGPPGYATGYQSKLVCTDTMNEWCKLLTIKTLTEVNLVR